ncbi:MAG: glutamine--fructose-6-phosphate transaminase (isomerizing) [Burkholderiaceae bacterium]|nr:MAG: glutamine--fructose-6-phosphate transaminase (isomerizing) [Burkholderiaceae bacterium]
MCGIVGAVAQNNIVPILLQGLKRLEYRGYDSCGVAVLNDGLQRARSVSRVAELEHQIEGSGLSGTVGISHTRWATHGAPATNNAHPHFSRDTIALVHNGIIENYEELRRELKAQGYVFESQTDTEVVAHLIHQMYDGDLFRTVQHAAKRLHGAYAIAVFCKDEPGRVVGARFGSPLILGVGADGNYLASDAMALAGVTDQIVYLEEGDVVDLRLDRYTITDQDNQPVAREVRTVHAHSGAAELGPYRHYMQKEIFEQPRAVADTLEGVEQITPEIFGTDAQATFAQIDSLLILACGTSYYSGLTAKYWLESIAKIPTQVEIASEYRYRDSVPNPKTLVVVISQSGETADTLAALKHAQALGMQHTLAICNVGTSAMVRQTKLHYLTRAGVEIGVASTKAFTTQLAALFLLTLTLAKLRGHLPAAQEQTYLKLLRHVPAALQSVLALEPQIIAWAEEFARKENALFLGRGLHYPIALEGALKLKEISYIHAEAYPAGELKHGPLALVTEHMPVVTVAPNDALLEKLKSNMQEVRARSGQLYVFADGDTQIQSEPGLHVIRMPEHYGALSPILHVVPLQLLAYHTALARGTDVDKPRNLAKSVTVE